MNPKKSRPRDPDRVRHMLEAVKAINRYTAGCSIADFMVNDLLQSAVERQFEILGEAAAHVSAAVQTLWPSIDWRDAKDFRNLISHEYFRVDYATVWHVSQTVIPAMEPALEALFADLDQQFGPDTNV
ncbi:MAG: DUF86 domain-containing protein [Cytophagaceae bacterium]|nr:MAG: DUF86 domain-containing protein [Cytophagaceae bacterium]